MKDNQLEVGDVLYGWGRGSFGSIYRTKVVRLTPKQAIMENGTKVVNKLELKWIHDSTLSARIVGEYGSLSVETAELKEEYRESQLRIKARNLINSISISKITLEQCEGLIKLFS